MLKELWTLIRLLFASKPGDVEKVELMGMDHFPFRDYKYMMWCGKMIYRNDMKDVRQVEWLTKAHDVVVNHETIHLMQAKVCGSWAKYYLKYLWEWLKPGFLAPMKANYLTSPYESEAYANELKMDYCKTYDGSNLAKYTFRNRKKLYKKVGNSSKMWKTYVKTLKFSYFSS